MKLNGFPSSPRSSAPRPVYRSLSTLARIGHALIASVIVSLIVQLAGRLIGVSLMPELVGALVFAATLALRGQRRTL